MDWIYQIAELNAKNDCEEEEDATVYLPFHNGVDIKTVATHTAMLRLRDQATVGE